MDKLLKKILYLIVLTLLLVPLLSFRGISEEFCTTLSGEEHDTAARLSCNNAPNSSPEKNSAKSLSEEISVNISKAISENTSAGTSKGTTFPQNITPPKAEQQSSSKEVPLNNPALTKEEVLFSKSPAPKEKIAYLTFDDGPSSQVTPQILAILREYDLQATFFVVGEMAEQNPELIRQIRQEGHTIGNHTYSHKYKYLYASPDNFLADVKKCEEILKTILGEDFETKLLRFPAGSFEKKKQPFRARVHEEGYLNIDWNVLNGDAEALSVPANVLVNRLKETLKNKDEAIILMHDNSTKATTAEALPEIIDYLQAEGYVFQTLENHL